ncbi:MAG: (Fe-S)-binding protein [Planctomycetes bacterium]|nr:(Fe-S)-binding protein [Planctomycetota bacterium]
MKVLLYVTCIVDQCWPEIGLASATLLEHLDCEVVVDDRDTCCGQPFCNSGYPARARPLAQAVIESFERSGADFWVAPSGSCTAQVKHYPALFADDPDWRMRAERLARRSSELSQFLQQRGLRRAPGRFAGRVAWHDACHGLRELGIAAGPRDLLATVAGLELVEFDAATACCGFGGTFAAKLPAISVAIADHKLDRLQAAEVAVLASGDASCLLHLRGRLERRGLPVRVMHLAELLTAGTE